MSVQFNWEDQYSVGNPEIDVQHQLLFSLANDFDENASRAELNRLIMRLFEYTRSHFQAEEDMMAEIEFPLLEEHQKLHEGLISKLGKISAESLDSVDARMAFKTFFFTWLIDHILVQDNKYFQFVNQ